MNPEAKFVYSLLGWSIVIAVVSFATDSDIVTGLAVYGASVLAVFAFLVGYAHISHYWEKRRGGFQ